MASSWKDLPDVEPEPKGKKVASWKDLPDIPPAGVPSSAEQAALTHEYRAPDPTPNAAEGVFAQNALQAASLGMGKHVGAMQDAAARMTGEPVDQSNMSLREKLLSNLATNAALAKQAVGHPLDTLDRFSDLTGKYLTARDAEDAQASRAHPFAAAGGRVLGSIPQTLLGPAGMAATGGITGAAESTDHPIAGGAGGAALGYLGGKFPATTSAVVGGGMTAFGDKLGMTPEERAIAAFGGAAGLVSGVGRAVAGRMRNRNAAKADELIAPLRDAAEGARSGFYDQKAKVTTQAEDAAVNDVLSESAKAQQAHEARGVAASKAQQDYEAAVAAKAAEVAKRDQSRYDDQNRQADKARDGLTALEAQKAKAEAANKAAELKALGTAGREVRNGQKAALSEYDAQAKAHEAERLAFVDLARKQLRQQMSSQVPKTPLEKLIAESQKLDVDESAIPGQVAAKRAAEFGGVGGRVATFKNLIGKSPEELAPDLAPQVQKIKDSYVKNTPDVIGADPDVAATNYGEQLKAKIAADREANAALQAKVKAGADPKAAAKELLDQKPLDADLLKQVAEALVARKKAEDPLWTPKSKPQPVQPKTREQMRAEAAALVKTPEWADKNPALADRLANPARPPVPESVALPVIPPEPMSATEALHHARSSITPPATEPMPQPPKAVTSLPEARALAAGRPNTPEFALEHPELARKLETYAGDAPPPPPKDALVEGLSTRSPDADPLVDAVRSNKPLTARLLDILSSKNLSPAARYTRLSNNAGRFDTAAKAAGGAGRALSQAEAQALVDFLSQKAKQ